MGGDTARGLAAGLYHETGATRRRERHDTTLETRDKAPCAAIQCATRPGDGHDTALVRSTTRPSARHALDLGAVGAQLGSGCAFGAPNPVLTQCTVFSHCLDHYS